MEHGQKNFFHSRSVKKRFRITREPVRENIAYDEKCDGIFPLITSIPLTPEEVLQNYKYQPMLEKRYEQTESDYSIMPLLFKRIGRIKAFLFMFLIEMLIETLIERSVRLSMKIEGIPLYHERRSADPPEGIVSSRYSAIFNSTDYMIGEGSLRSIRKGTFLRLENEV